MNQIEPKSNYYSLIYADPPWAFKTFSENGHGRSSEAHYDCMSIEGIKQLPVRNWAAKDSILLMWVRDPMLPHALEVIHAWGFTFKTVGFYWAKLNKSSPELYFTKADFFTGMGYWTRANVEQCLLATCGSPKRNHKDVKKLVVSHRRAHSQKPEEVYSSIERLADGPYLEMFSRSSRSGWDSWGTEVGLLDQGQVETRRIPSHRNDKTRPQAASESTLKYQ